MRLETWMRLAGEALIFVANCRKVRFAVEKVELTLEFRQIQILRCVCETIFQSGPKVILLQVFHTNLQAFGTQPKRTAKHLVISLLYLCIQ